MKEYMCSKCLDLTERQVIAGRSTCLRCEEAYTNRLPLKQIRKLTALAEYVADNSPRYRGVMEYYIKRINNCGTVSGMSPHAVRLQYQVDNGIIHITKRSNKAGAYILEEAQRTISYPQVKA